VLRHWVVVKGQKCGTFGDSFIFNGNKIITTSGGGAIVVPNKGPKKDRAIFMPHSPEIMHLITSTVK
jgi:dTDP-4-amino-4,6-dideoxygalactose transaminase